MDGLHLRRTFLRRLFLCIVFLAVLTPAVLPQQNPQLPSIEGRVVRAADRTPIGGAEVELIGIENGQVRSRTQTTKDDGVFQFRDLVAGTAYQIVVTGPGLQPTAHGQSGSRDPWNPITLTPGQQLTGVEITPQLLTGIRGRVLAGNGEPLEYASVTLMRMAYVGGRRALDRVQDVTANARGEYRFSALPTGIYYLRATPRFSKSSLMAELYLTNPAQLVDGVSVQSVPADEPRGYPISYYPGGSLERATPIRIGDGTILENIDFRIEEVRTGRLQGTVTGPSGKPGTARLLLIPEGGALDSNWTRSVQSANGKFDIRGVLPGSYVLLASGVEAGRDVSARMAVAIGNDEAKSIDVTLAPRASIQGRITVDDWPGPNKPELQRLVIVLVPASMAAVDSTLLGPAQDLPSGRAIADAEGNFTIANVPPWEYRVVVVSVQNTERGPAVGPISGAYVKSAQLAGRDVLAEGFSVGTTPLENLEIVLATSAASLDGRVTTPDGDDAAFARVVLIPEDRRRADLFLNATASITGRFEFQFLTPGKYKLFAWQGLPEGAWLDPEFLRVYEDAGTPVEILPDTVENVDLRVITE